MQINSLSRQARHRIKLIEILISHETTEGICVMEYQHQHQHQHQHHHRTRRRSRRRRYSIWEVFLAAPLQLTTVKITIGTDAKYFSNLSIAISIWNFIKVSSIQNDYREAVYPALGKEYGHWVSLITILQGNWFFTTPKNKI
uniref:Uncharacterized protein n=1 Tax=Glossina palpalis gambiensis TaxID=67801 RepID=A0A1B0C6G7_9MUSC